MKDPVDHILRSRLPWRGDEAAITECGYDASRVKTLTREEYSLKGKRRAWGPPLITNHLEKV